jgi:hypothetical protein
MGVVVVWKTGGGWQVALAVHWQGQVASGKVKGVGCS